MADITIIPLPDGAAKKIHKTLYKTPRTPIAIVSGTTVYPVTIDATANAKRIALEIPAISGANPTTKLTIENSDSVEIYESPSTIMVENENHVIVTNVPLVGTNTVKVTLSTDPLSSATGYLTLFLEGGD